MDFTDKTLKCVDCSEDFVFTAGEQIFFFEKKFINEPKRCKKCKARTSGKNPLSFRETRVLCSACGLDTIVPFKPSQGRPVLCRSCFQAHGPAPSASIEVRVSPPELLPHSA